MLFKYIAPDETRFCLKAALPFKTVPHWLMDWIPFELGWKSPKAQVYFKRPTHFRVHGQQGKCGEGKAGLGSRGDKGMVDVRDA